MLQVLRTCLVAEVNLVKYQNDIRGSKNEQFYIETFSGNLAIPIERYVGGITDIPTYTIAMAADNESPTCIIPSLTTLAYHPLNPTLCPNASMKY